MREPDETQRGRSPLEWVADAFAMRAGPMRAPPKTGGIPAMLKLRFPPLETTVESNWRTSNSYRVAIANAKEYSHFGSNRNRISFDIDKNTSNNDRIAS